MLTSHAIDPVDFIYRNDAEAISAVETTLAQTGISTADMPSAVEAVRRITRRETPADVRPVAEFVGAVAATTGVSGPALLLIPHLAEYAGRIWGIRR